MSEGGKLTAMLRVILLLQEDRAGNASDLAATLGVTNRSVHRYLAQT